MFLSTCSQMNQQQNNQKSSFFHHMQTRQPLPQIHTNTVRVPSCPFRSCLIDESSFSLAPASDGVCYLYTVLLALSSMTRFHFYTAAPHTHFRTLHAPCARPPALKYDDHLSARLRLQQQVHLARVITLTRRRVSYGLITFSRLARYISRSYEYHVPLDVSLNRGC